MSRVIIFPTDTVYGIGCQIYDTESIEKIYFIKKRSKDKPLACLCANLEQIESITFLNETARKLINTFLPGALTIILKSKDEVVEKIGYTTLGVRIPNSKVALDILEKKGPMLTTSVNDSGEEPINDYKKLVDIYSSVVDEIFEPQEKMQCISSTVISIIDGELKILREGSISLKQINDALNV